MWRTVVLALAGLLGGTLSGCAGCRGKPSVLLITVDTLRPDRLSSYGYTAQTTPAIDALAEQGVLFERAVCDVPWTTGSMASVMTGTFATHHGVRLRTERLAEAQVTLAEVLQTHGYQTGGIVGSFPVASVYGLNQGFQSYDDELTTPIAGPLDGAVDEIAKVPDPIHGPNRKWLEEKFRHDAYRPDGIVSERAVAWLRAHQAAPFFLWVHYFGPHERVSTHAGPVSDQEPRIVADYDGDLQKTDAAVKRLLAAVTELGMDKSLLVILHADHGQSLGEHHFVGHGMDLYDASVRIPLLMRFPARIAAGTRVHQLVRNVDIMPTVLDALGVPLPANLDGRSLLPVFAGKQLPDQPAYAETYIPTVVLWPITVSAMGTVLGPMARYALRTERWKFVESNLSRPCAKGASAYRRKHSVPFDRWELEGATALPADDCDRLRVDELYDVTTDPGELHDVAATNADLVQQFQGMLHAQVETAKAGEPLHLSPADSERLQSLGYRTGNEPAAEEAR